MKAKDTVMSFDASLEEYNHFVSDYAESIAGEDNWDLRSILEAQAEISFKAGEDKGYAHARQHCEDVIIPQAETQARKEVVDWLERAKKIKVPNYQKKEWGILGDE